MALPDIFNDDSATERLASYFEELYEYLLEQGVPDECLPSPWHVLRRVTKAIDHELLREWLDAYSAVEAEEGEAYEIIPQEEIKHEPRGKRRPRPSYLRALDSESDFDEEQKPDGESASNDDIP